MSLRVRLLVVFLLSILSGLGSVVYWVLDELEPRYQEAQEDILVDFSEFAATWIGEQAVQVDANGNVQIDTGLLAKTFSTIKTRPLNARIYDLVKTDVDIRLYVTDAGGTVIFDSEGQQDLGKDYSQWRDVYLTLRGQYGARSSDDDMGDPTSERLYIASPLLHQGDIIGVVAIGKPTRNINRFIAHLSTNLVYTSVAIALATLLVGLLITFWITRPMHRLEAYALGVSQGKRVALPPLGNNEVGRVGDALESMRVALEGKSYVADYVQSLTHELKSPIAGIRGAAELLQEPMTDEQRNRFLNNIIEQGSRMQSLIERLLDLAAIEYQNTLNDARYFAATDLMDNVCCGLEYYARQHQVMLDKQCEEGLNIYGDFALLSDALGNLVKNAIEFAPANSSVIIRAEQTDESIGIEVLDSGPGVPAFAEEKLTQRFYCLPKPDGTKGSGLGLSFVHEIMQLHGGELSYRRQTEVEPNVTEFRLGLPSEYQSEQRDIRS
ncbi:two-component system sensor histidine kinase CreC [Marinobacterium halophilum]|uniref:histidine kinase n=1 Tax=Marinobacterium halophilum TaxID=267374 RepID=A0A2P8EZS9_9GAMM|nr:two-component system sensor histidine kinase CreC [Marinobacterium halophilum]PSL14965.1 two-component system sensor histidine kinase CreC [Marinobacterium halophilum]